MKLTLKNQLPGVYQNFLPEKLLGLSVQETKATCHNCLRSRDKRFSYKYNPSLKCCTFFPFTPNFAVGGILSKNLQTKTAIEHKIRQRSFTLPLGIFPDPQYQFNFKHKKTEDFGRRDDLLCPWYDFENENCGHWEYRGTVCTTFFCRSDYGKKGVQFWSSLNDFLSYLEMALAEECLVQLDFSPRDISDQLVFLNKDRFNEKEKKQKSLSLQRYKSYWNGYNDEYDFYLRCYNIVNKLRPTDLKDILSHQGQNLMQVTFEKAASLKK